MEKFRSITIYRDSNKKYIMGFYESGEVKHRVISYIIVSHEVMVDWIERGILPEYSYT